MCALTWEDAVEDLQFVRVLPPQAQDVVLPADHLAENEHDGDGGQPDEEEQRVSPLHNIQALLMADYLDTRGDNQNGNCLNSESNSATSKNRASKCVTQFQCTVISVGCAHMWSRSQTQAD